MSSRPSRERRPLNKRIADDFRRKVPGQGSSADGMTLYRDFRGKDPDKIPMLRSRGTLDRSRSLPTRWT